MIYIVSSIFFYLLFFSWDREGTSERGADRERERESYKGQRERERERGRKTGRGREKQGLSSPDAGLQLINCEIMTEAPGAPLLIFFIFLRKRRKNPKQAPHSVWSTNQGSIPQPWIMTSAKVKSQMLNRLIHPGTPYLFLLINNSYFKVIICPFQYLNHS